MHVDETPAVEAEEDPVIGVHNYLETLEKKQTEMNNSPDSLALLQKLQILLESNRDLDHTISYSLSYMPNGFLEPILNLFLSANEEAKLNYANVIKTLVHINERMQKTKSDFNNIVLSYLNRRFPVFQNVFEMIGKWDGNFRGQEPDESERQLNEAIAKVLDYTTKIAACIKQSTASLQKVLIISYDGLSLAKRLNLEKGETGAITALLKSIIDEMNQFEIVQNFPTNMVAEVAQLNVALEMIGTVISQLESVPI